MTAPSESCTVPESVPALVEATETSKSTTKRIRFMVAIIDECHQVLMNAILVDMELAQNHLSGNATNRELTAKATSTQNPNVLPTESRRLFIYGTRTSFCHTDFPALA
jgi:hypothetical protein